MRFMMIVKASKDSEAGKMPSEELLAATGLVPLSWLMIAQWAHVPEH